MPNPSPNYSSAPQEIYSARGAVAVDADGADQTVSARGVYIGGSGTLRVQMWNGDIITFQGLVPGLILPISIKKVYTSGTTAAATLKAVALL